jgi:hypothetical protein
MIVLLPKLEVGIPAVLFPCLPENIQHPFFTALPPMLRNGFDDLLAGEFFEVAEDVASVVVLGTDNHVYMVAHQAPGIQQQSLFLLAVTDAVNKYGTIVLSRKDVHPSNDCERYEMDAFFVADLITMDAHGSKAGFF